MSNHINVLVVEPLKFPYVLTIEDSLEEMQGIVRGYIEAIYPFDDQVAIICNEEGKLNGYELNRSLKDDDGKILDIIAGPFFVCGLTDDNFGTLPENLIEKYEKLFYSPEIFLKRNEEIVSIKATEAKESDDKEELLPWPISN